MADEAVQEGRFDEAMGYANEVRPFFNARITYTRTLGWHQTYLPPPSTSKIVCAEGEGVSDRRNYHISYVVRMYPKAYVHPQLELFQHTHKKTGVSYSAFFRRDPTPAAAV